jgi:hypothetical protein
LQQRLPVFKALSCFHSFSFSYAAGSWMMADAGNGNMPQSQKLQMRRGYKGKKRDQKQKRGKKSQTFKNFTNITNGYGLQITKKAHAFRLFRSKRKLHRYSSRRENI